MIRTVNSLLYALLAGAGAAVLAPPLLASLRALGRPWSYEPDLRWPWLWLALGLALFLTLADAARRIAARRPVGLARYAALLVLVGACGASRRLVQAPPRPVVEDALAHLMSRTEHAAAAHWAEQKRYPLEAEGLSRGWSALLSDLGYRSRGALPLKSRLVVRPGASGPVLVAPEEVRPGDVVFAVDASRRAYWMTAFLLNAEGRRVPYEAQGRVVVSAGREGQAASRLDPLFPEYPRKLTPRGGVEEAPEGGGAGP